jgi:fumarate reductase flavoprotein subunit
MFDVVVIGAGLAGLTAANRAAAAGLRVAVLEQGADEAYLCNSRVATGALNFAHSSPRLPPDDLVRAVMADTEDHADPVLARALAETVGRGLDWLLQEGATFVQRSMQEKETIVLAPPRSFTPGLDWQGRGADVLLRRLAANFVERGGELRLATRAVALATEGRRCCGVAAEGAQGRLELQAGAVVLADGGFQADAELVGRYISPRPQDLVQRSAATGRGSAARMAAEVGVRLVDMDRFYGHLLSRTAMTDSRLWPYPTLDCLTGGSIMVDRSGRRVFDEGLGGIALSNRIAALDDPLSMTIIFDEAIWATTGRDEVVPPNPFLLEAKGELHVADDLATLAAKIGIPADRLAATVAEYNAAVAAGTLDRLDPPRSPGRRFGVIRNAPDRIPPRVVAQAPFYAAPLAVGISCTIGGILIDAHCRAIGEDGAPVPGLYAAGSCTGGVEGGPIAGYIGGLSKALTTGLIAAEHIARAHAA